MIHILSKHASESALKKLNVLIHLKYEFVFNSYIIMIFFYKYVDVVSQQLEVGTSK